MANEYTPVFDQEMARKMVVAANEGNELANTEFAQDIQTAPYGYLVNKYGQEVADNRRLYTQERAAVAQIENADRSNAQVVGDTGLAVASGLVNAVGSLGSLTLAAAGETDQYFDEENDGFSRAGVWASEKTQQATQWIKSFQSDELQDRQGLSGVERQLDAQDNLDQFNRETNNGEDASFIDDLTWVGRGTLNNLGRVGSNAAIAGDVIAEGLGSLGPSAKLASVASGLVTRTATYNAAKIANAIAPTQGTKFLAMGAEGVNRAAIASAVGVSEAAGVYSQTVNEVLGMKHGELMETSEEYATMVGQGVDPDDAKTTLAANAGIDAFKTSFPMAASLGIIAGRFEAMPIKSFRGSGFIGGLRQVGAQTLEEGGQGASGQLATNLAIRDTGVDPNRTPGEGVDEALATGMIAGTGMAGVLAAPSALGEAPRKITETTKAVVNSPAIKGAVSAVGSAVTAGGSALDAAAKNLENSPQAMAALRGVRAAGAKVTEKVTPVADAVVNQAKDFNTRPDRDAQSKTLAALSEITELSVVELTTKIDGNQSDKELNLELARKSAVQSIARNEASGSVPSTFSNTTTGNTTLARVGGIISKLSEKGVRINKMSDSDVLYAASEIQNLRSSITNLPTAMRAKVKDIIASEDFKNIQKRVTRIDLMKTQDETKAVTDDMVTETKLVAAVNPANINPVVAGKILEQNDRTDVTPQDIQNLKTAKRIGEAITSRSEAYVEAQKKEVVELSVKPEYREGKKQTKPVDLVEAISRNIFLGSGDTRAPSVGQFASQIMQGAQNPDGTVEIDGIPTDVNAVTDHFTNFAQHMINKVDALNRSFANRDANGNGTAESFDNLGPNRKIRPGRTENGAVQGKAVTYQGASPGGIRFADEMYADAVAAVEVYNALVEAFPERFPAGVLSVPDFAPNATQSPLSDTSDPQTDVAEVETEAAPTAVEEVSAPAETDEQDAEVTPPTLAEMMAAETRTKDDFSAMSYEDLIESANRWFVEEEGMGLEAMPEARQTVIKEYTDSIIAYFNLPTNLVTGITWLRTPDAGHMGQAMWGERLIAMRAGAVRSLLGPNDTEGFRTAEHTVFHELMHIIDAYASNDVTRPVSHSSKLFDTITGEEGAIYKEVVAAVDSDPEMKTHFDYALSYNNIDTLDALASEIFAEIGALYLRNTDLAREKFPEGVKYVENIIEQAGGTIVGEATDGSATQESSGEENVSTKTSVADKTFDNVSPQFNESFLKRKGEFSYADGDGILAMVEAQPGTKNYVEFVRLYKDRVIAEANNRLATLKVNKSKKDELPIKDRIIAGDEEVGLYRRNKNTIAVDRTTGEYDPDLLSIAAVAVLDWLTGARSQNIKNLDETLEDMNLTYDMVTDDQINTIMNGINPRDAAETLAKDIVRMWGLRINPAAPMVDARGAAEGMAKELLEALLTVSEQEVAANRQALIGRKIVPYVDPENAEAQRQEMIAKAEADEIDPNTVIFKVKPVDQIIFDTSVMREFQQAIGLTGQEASKKMLAPELDTMPSIGAPARSIDNTQSRGDVKLSRREKKTLERMQNQGHGLNVEFSGMVDVVGQEVLAKFLGEKDFSELSDRHPVRASIAGKNLSIERDFQEAMSVINGVKNAGFTVNGGLPQVFYRVGISRVGRHQFKGINPQNNKILRALVTPTKSLLNMDKKRHKDAFWLTVAQAADISGFNKVENQHHKYLLENIQREFYAKYGEAVEMIGEHLEGRDLDGAALVEAMGGTGEMQQLAAVFAVAQLEKALLDGTQGAFETTLSFELDGKTDGPGNMMANFGQGILTEQDFMNFKRVGFFLGTKNMTLNKFFGNGTERDLYEVTSLKGQMALHNAISNGKFSDKAKFHAIANLASAFGDLKIENGQFVLTRNASKNPMTKTVYGSSERGIGVGLAQDMMLKMYQALIDNPDGIVDYPGGKEGFEADFSTAFGMKFPTGRNWKKDYLGQNEVDNFTKAVTQTLGKVLSDTAKEVIGDEITKVNDTLVLMTAFQTEFLTAKFRELLDAKVAERVADGSIKVNERTGVPDRSSLTQADYDAVVAQIRAYSPTYANGMQTLDIGSLGATNSGIRLSESMTGTFQAPSTMVSPELAGVKVIPYITQGRGDAMMMNWIYGGETAPENTLQVFDGIDMPIDKIFEYAQQINSAVLQNWEADVIGDIVNDVTGFLEKTTNDGDLLLNAWTRAFESAQKKKTTATAKTPQALIGDVNEMQRRNQARKAVFKRIGVSVDHMGGSDTAFTQGPDGRDYTLGEINDMIRKELGERALQNQNDQTVDPDGSIDGEFTEINLDAFQIEDQRAPVEGEFSKLVVTDAATVMDSLLRETRNKPVAAAVRILQKANLQTRIVIGSPEEVSQWYSDNIGEMDGGLKQDKKGIYDPVNDVMLITDNNHETMVHELIHAATFKIVEAFYNGDQTHKDTIGRLEVLNQEFLDMDFSNAPQSVQDSANSAKSQILSLQVEDTAFSKAAALNEMMAWTLSNEGLMKELGQKQTSLMARMTKVLKALMQRLLGGVKSDMLSNIQFNTELLIIPSETLALPAPVEDTLDELTPGAQKMTNFWIDLAEQRLDEAVKSTGRVSEKVTQISDYRKNAQSAIDTLTFGGFTLSAYQRETFKAIHMVLAMEMRLNPQSAAALNDMFKHVTDNLTPAMFGPTNEQDRYSAVMEIFGETKNDEGVSDAIAVLLALSQTSRGFRAAIDQLSVPESIQGISNDSVNDFLSSLTGMLLNKAIGSIDLNGQSVSETLDQLSESILLEASEKEFRILSGLMNNINKADDWGKGAFKKLAGFTEAVNDELRASNRSQLTKLTFGAVTAATAFMDQERADIQAQALKRVTHMGTNLDFAVFAREFVAEVIGTDQTNAKITSMLDEVTFNASAVRQNYREDLPVMFQNEFENHPDAAQWRAAHKVLGKTDFAMVYDQDRPNTSFEYFKDENLIDDEILVHEAAIRANFSAPIANVILEKSQQLADFMNGKGPGHQLWRNAHAINTLAGEFKPPMTEEIDRLVSFYAMKGSDPQMRQEIARMYENDPVAMQNLAVYMRALNKEEDSKVVSEEALMNGFKGYVPDLGQPGTKMIIAKDEDKRDLEKKGYKRVADAWADDGFSSVNRGYYITSTKQTGTYSQGVMQIIQDTYRGVDATSGLSVSGMTSGVITGAAVVSVTNWLNSLTSGLADNKEAFLPVYSTDGVLHYERFINPDLLEKYTAPKNNLALMLGAWAGRQVEEKIAQKYNAALIDQLKTTYDERDEGDDNQFINLPEMAKAQKLWDEATVAERRNMKKPDPVYVESWKVISPQTKRYIEEVFGKDTFMVRKDQMNIALGYRDPSVIDLWTGNTRVPDGMREGVQAITGLVMGDAAMKNLAFAEKGVQGLVSTAKDLIVVRSLVVPYMNTQANVVQLSTRGVPLKEQLKGYKNKLAEIEKFNLNSKELMRLDTRIQLAGADTNKIRILQSQKQVIMGENARMSVAPLIKAGAYKNISEGLSDMDVEITGGRLGDWVEKKIDSIPNAGVRTIAKYGILSKDTAIYKGANKAVQYGDFLAKAIYYDHLMSKGLSHDDAMKLVNEEFVNFSVLPGRTRQYLEGVGATWFLAFKIRIMKIAMNQIRENPARSLILGATIADYGSPQADNLASVIVDERIGYPLGWDMLFNSPGLNPWVNLTE